eukprot:scaffold289818_cov18-Tisochrysis_lutea.AAC.1
MDSAVRAAGRVAWLVAEALIMGLEVWKAVEDTPSQAVVPSLFSKGQKAPPPQLPSDFQAVQYWTSLKSPNVLRPNLYCTMARNIQGTRYSRTKELHGVYLHKLLMLLVQAAQQLLRGYSQVVHLVCTSSFLDGPCICKA